MIVHPCDISKPPPSDIRKDLMNEYDALGRPGNGKTVRAVIQDVEDEMSKNLEFSVKKEGNVMYLYCGGKKRVKLEDAKLKPQIFRERNTGIPFMTNGRVQTRCVRFFQVPDDVESTDCKTGDSGTKNQNLEPTPSGDLPKSGLVLNKLST